MSSKVHRVRYYNPKPQPINCASLNKSAKQLAIARGDASIEIWDTNNSPYLLKCIPSTENGSVEALCWVNDRLLSTGLSGALLEWDLEALDIKNSTVLTGYAAWCLDVSPDNILAAVGTEQGYVNLFNVENGSIVYEKLFDKQEGRILCCKFDVTGKVLATGSIDTIRVWNVSKGLVTSRISVQRRGVEVIVWCLAFLSDSTLVSGDSAGRLTFWDSSIGDQIESYTTHKADLVSIALSDDEKNIYCSGVDPVILHFTKVDHTADGNEKSKQLWVKNVQRHIHEHDVRVLITLGERELISLGVDGYLTLSSFPPKWIMRVPPMIPPPRSGVCAKKKLLLLRYSNYFEVWKLGTYKTKQGYEVTNAGATNGDKQSQNKTESTARVEQDSTDAMYRDVGIQDTKITLKIQEKPVNLISVKTKKQKQMLCCELAPTAEYVFYSTATDVRLIKLELDEEQNNIFVSKLSVNGVKAPCDRVAFTDDSQLLVTHRAGVGELLVLQVDSDVGATLVQTINTAKHFKAKSLLHLVISKKTASGATYLIAADTKSGVAIWTLNGKKFEPYAILPTYQCVPSALSVDSERALLYIVYVDQTIVEYELPTKKFAEWPASVFPDTWRTRTAAIQSVSGHPTKNAVVLQDQNSFWVVDKELKPESTKNKKGRKQNAQADMKLRFKILPVKYLAGFHWLGKDEAVTIELLPGNILAQLPPVVAQKKH